MDFAKTLKQIDDALAPEPKVVMMTQPQFETYASDQIEKAKKDKEKDKEMGAAKSKKRLEALKAILSANVQKDMWSGDNATAAIPVYEEPNLTVDSEKSETEVPLQNMQSMGNSAWAGEGGTVGFAKQVDQLGKEIDALSCEAPALPRGPGPAHLPPDLFAWPADITDAEFQKSGVAKSESLWGRDSDTK